MNSNTTHTTPPLNPKVAAFKVALALTTFIAISIFGITHIPDAQNSLAHAVELVKEDHVKELAEKRPEAFQDVQLNTLECRRISEVGGKRIACMVTAHDGSRRELTDEFLNNTRQDIAEQVGKSSKAAQ